MSNIFLKTPKRKKNQFFSDFELSDFTPIKSSRKNGSGCKNLNLNYSTANKCNFDIFSDDKRNDDFYGGDIANMEGLNFLEEDNKECYELKKILNFENISESNNSLKQEFPDF